MWTTTLAPDTETALVAAVALVNSAETADGLRAVADLDNFFATFDYTGAHTGTESELAEVRAVRPFLRELLTADEGVVVELVNATLVDRQAIPQLVRHDTYAWHLHATQQDAPLAERITIEVVMAMIDLLRAGERSRIAECDADGCRRLLVDTSKNRSRRFCSVACANRMASAAYRGRRRNERVPGRPVPGA